MNLQQLTALGLAALLAACGQEPESDNPTDSAPAKMTGEMSDMGMPADMAGKMAKGTGTVTAIDKVQGTITIAHAPIPEANWPAMSMAFRAKPEMLDSIAVGQKVIFDLELKDGSGEITTVAEM